MWVDSVEWVCCCLNTLLLPGNLTLHRNDRVFIQEQLPFSRWPRADPEAAQCGPDSLEQTMRDRSNEYNGTGLDLKLLATVDVKGLNVFNSLRFYLKVNKKDGYRQQNVRQRQKLISIRGLSRSLKLMPFKNLGAVSYSSSIVTMAVSAAVLEIFSVKEWPDLEVWVWGPSGSLKKARFHRPCMTFY